MKKINAVIVDDFAIFRKSLKLVLSRYTGIGNIEIEEASDGLEFLKLIKNKQPDIVFMDIQMPKMNGIEATQLAIEKYPDLKIIAVSASDDLKSVQGMERAGAKAYLTKGFDKQIFISIILKVLSGNKQFIKK
ncbi:MAG: response regulator transcription factor [Bacteroidales bacterium]|nr:response regulator transcription factor [Bacteroidales bacterium]